VNKKLRELKEQLLFRIDPDDLLEVDKVNRYIKLRELDMACSEAIERDGATIVIENASQRFIKAHPAMNEKSKLNSQMIALEKSINFTNGNLVPSSSSPASSVEGKKGDYEPGDLV
jgi:subtilase family serine protease